MKTAPQKRFIIMNIEKNIFQRVKVNFAKLSEYGFEKSDNLWIYRKTFFNNEFRAVVKVNQEGEFSGNVYETNSDDIYFPLRVESMHDGFVGKIRCEYETILNDIKNNCCHLNYFVFPQANRLSQAIYKKYGNHPVFPWPKYNGHGVFKNSDNNKWYAIVMNIDKSKLDKNLSGEIEVVNVKLDEAEITDLLKQQGFYPAYHMNKKNWITITLDETLSDEAILSLTDKSYRHTLEKKAKRQKWDI